ncbi:MAG: hypothetical protein GVY35_06000 [Bacteroidetes bacterium]|jgi:flagellar basal body L-ring protein FlgH|nr:hypothetical protein [Bacteroidota bacterium]
MLRLLPLRFATALAVFALAGWLLPPPAAAQSLYADARARQPGDVLTVLLSESTSAQRESSSQNQSNSSLGGSGTADGPSIAGTFGLDAEFSNASERLRERQRDRAERPPPGHAHR